MIPTTRLSVAGKLALYLGTVVLSGVILIVAFKLWAADLHIPFRYGGDGLTTLAAAKCLLAHGWYVINPQLGAPGVSDLRDYPNTDVLNYLFLKLLVVLTHNFAVGLNALYLLSFPLTALTAVFAFRKLGLAWYTALVSALLYTFLPYHLFRNIGHLFLAIYYTVPFGVLLMCWVIREEVDFFPAAAGGRFRIAGRQAWTAVVLAIWIACTGIYYAFFTAVLLLVGAVVVAVRQRSARHLRNAAIPVMLIMLTVGMNVAPDMVYQHRMGKDPDAVVRGRNGETYALKITQLVIPVDGHRWHPLAALKAIYNDKAPLVNENSTATLGIVGSLGFLFLLGHALFVPRTATLISDLATLNLFTVLFATIGGLGSLLTLVTAFWIRSFNRISVFISFLSLLAVGLLLDRLLSRWRERRVPAICGPLLLTGILLIGLLDEIPIMNLTLDAQNARLFQQDHAYFTRCEAALPAGAMVMQLPYIRFPEAPKTVGQMADVYDHLRGYIHTQHLHWSFGAMCGRPDDLWQRQVSGLPTEPMLRELAQRGFDGLYINRLGYADNGKQFEREIRRVITVPPLVSADGSLALYRLTDYRRALGR